MTKRLDSLNFRQGKELRLNKKESQLISSIETNVSSFKDAKLALELADKVSKLPDGATVKDIDGNEFTLDTKEDKKNYETLLDSMALEYFERNINNFTPRIKDEVKRLLDEHISISEKRDEAIGSLVVEIRKELSGVKNEIVSTSGEVVLSSYEEGTNNLELYKYKKLKLHSHGKEVGSLQNILKELGFYNHRIDNDFGGKTKTAVKKLQRLLKKQGLYHSTIDGVVGRGTYKALVTYLSKKNDSGIVEKTIRHTNEGLVNRKIENYSASLDDAKKLFSNLDKIQEGFRRLAEHNDEGYSIWHAIKSIGLSRNMEAQLVAGHDKYQNLINQNQDKLQSAVTFILDKNDPLKVTNPHYKVDISKGLDFVNKAMPWLVGVYLFDLKIPFTAKTVPGTKLEDSLALKQWIKEGMPGDFKDYYKTHKNKGLDTVKAGRELISVLSTYVGSKTAQKFLSGRIDELNHKEKEVLLLFAKNVIYPQLKIAHDESFTIGKGGDVTNIFDSWFGLGLIFGFGDQARSEKVLKKLKEAIDSNDLEWIYRLMKKEVKVLKEEDEGSAENVVESTSNKVNYWGEIYKNHKTLKKVGKLLGLGENRISILYKFKDKEDFIHAYGLSRFKTVITKVYDNLSNGANPYAGLNKAQVHLAKGLFKVVGTDKLGEFKLKYLPKYKHINYVNRGLHKYGLDLRNAHTSAKKYELLSKYGVVKGENTIETLFKGLVNIQKLDNIGYNEFRGALRHLKEVPTSSLEGVLLNTSRQGLKSSAIKNFLSMSKHDNFVNHTHIDKTFTYVNNEGQKVTETVRYNIYLRPECSNLLIVPESIKTQKIVEDAPTLDTRMYDQIPLTIPVVIPYSVFKGKTNKPNKKEGDRSEIKDSDAGNIKNPGQDVNPGDTVKTPVDNIPDPADVPVDPDADF